MRSCAPEHECSRATPAFGVQTVACFRRASQRNPGRPRPTPIRCIPQCITDGCRLDNLTRARPLTRTNCSPLAFTTARTFGGTEPRSLVAAKAVAPQHSPTTTTTQNRPSTSRRRSRPIVMKRHHRPPESIRRGTCRVDSDRRTTQRLPPFRHANVRLRLPSTAIACVAHSPKGTGRLTRRAQTDGSIDQR